MTAIGIPANVKQLAALVKEGEGPTLEFKRSTGELKEGMQTLCAFLNGSGGMVLFGVRPDGTVEGQEVSDQTFRDIAQAADRFEPPAHLSIQRIKIEVGREVIAVVVEGALDTRPFTYEGRAYERVGSTTRRMPQAKYEKASASATSPSPARSFPASSSAWTRPSSRRTPCGKFWSTRSSIATTPSQAARSRSPSSTTAWRSGARAPIRRGSRPRNSANPINPCSAIPLSRTFSTRRA